MRRQALLDAKGLPMFRSLPPSGALTRLRARLVSTSCAIGLGLVVLGVGALAPALPVAPVAEACTSLLIPTSDGSFVYARTMEFAVDLQSQALVIPRNFAMSGTAAGGKPGKQWTTKYAAVGLNGLGFKILADGMNEKGLVGGILYFPDFAGYVAPEKADPAKSVAPWEMLTWALTSFASVDEVRAALDGIEIVALKPDSFPIIPPFHYTFHDASGQSIVVEPVNGVLKVYDNPYGVMTNSPSFDWHLTNLRNYVKLSPNNAPPLTVRGHVINSLGEGSGLLGMPGDATPPSRFIRAFAYAMSAKPVPSGERSVRLAEHIINNFDIPKGWVREQGGQQPVLEYTEWSSIADIKNRKYYVKTYDNQSLQVIDMARLDLDAKTLQLAPLAPAQAPQVISFGK